ncbi:MaoC/PaaZ C-terminal domain-containing protein [Saccharopolyspora sp. 5N102]|uniref:MaoC/PaaZ C-terminal domain-containing protein n=1 Tax=Saccharopolyspora sp. 5N102 TaxID=3375155 RepID=UPI0037B33A5F
MTAATARPAGEWRGVELGSRVVDYTERDAILYALAVGAVAADLDLVFEERLRVLPTFALTLAQWAPDALGTRGAFDTRTAVHGSQRFEVLAPLPRSGSLAMTASVAQVWDKGSAAIFEVAVESDYFVATWALFAPGCGGFGGERGPSSPRRPEAAADHRLDVATAPNQAALYRLLGDRHHMHIDPAAAEAAGQPRPFLHGLCTLAGTTLAVARRYGAHPADLRRLEGRFAAPVFPGDRLSVECWGADASAVAFGAAVAERAVLTGGTVSFG